VVTTVLDASALVAFLTDEPAKRQVEELLRRRPPPTISAVNLAETIDTLVRVGGADEGAVRDRVDWLIVGGLEVEPVWLRVARSAAAIRSRHYHHTRAPISHADAVCVATAMTLGSELATCDADLGAVARSLGVPVIALPDSAGRLPGVAHDQTRGS
jgi:PIN domain nuclease of toxin-antitoxin system